VKKSLTLLLILWGTACAPMQKLIATPTLIPMSQIDLEAILVIDGDLPEDIVPDIVTRENAVGSAAELDRADAVFTQYFLLNGGEGGGVSVFLFDSLDYVGAAFEKVSAFMTAPIVYDQVGEQARIEYFFLPVITDVPSIEGSRLIFTRCHALAVIQFPRAADVEAIGKYGLRLDGRLQMLVC
jgi:hypothetical protein